MSHKKAVSSTPSSSKKDNKKKTFATPGKDDGGDDAGSTAVSGNIRIAAVFQSKASTSNVEVEAGRCLLPASLMKTLGLRPGATLWVEVGSAPILCRVFPNKKANLSDLIVLNKVWQVNTEAPEGSATSSSTSAASKKVNLSTSQLGRTRLLPCRQLTLLLSAASKHLGISALVSSVEFRQYLHGMLRGACLRSHARLGLSSRGSPVVFQVLNLVSTISLDGLSEDTMVFYEISELTQIQILDSYTEMVSSASASKQSTFDNFADCVAEIERRVETEGFVGYRKEVHISASLMSDGLGLVTSNVNRDNHDLFSSPKGLIVHGAPGVGKSRLLRALTNTYSRLGVNVLSIDHSILLSQYQGEAESKMRKVFQQAKVLTPCIITIENLDLLCPSRSASTTSDMQKRLVSCYLSLIDELHTAEVEAGQRVFVLATSCKVLNIDSAVRRSGRIDREVELPVPSISERELLLGSILRSNGIQLRSLPSGEILSHNQWWIYEHVVQEAAKKAHGMVASDLVQVVKEAVFLQSLVLNDSNAANNQQPHPTTSIAVAPKEESPVVDLMSEFEDLDINDEASSSETTPNTIVGQVSPVGKEIEEKVFLTAVQKVSPSALREVVVEVPKVRWSDIGGMLSVKQSIRQVIELPLEHPEWFTTHNLPPLKGVLLYGPPGCSKTLLAKAVATESSMNFLAVRGPELLSKWLGESEKAVQSLFRRARAAAPSIIFFDEIDALAGVRGEASSGVSDRVLSQLLTELDGINSLKQVLVVAATNRPDMLDPALIRPGRIDRKIYVPPPDDKSRESILRLELGKMPISGILNYNEMVAKTNGFSGAEVVAVCNDAALLAIDQDELQVTHSHVMQAIDKIKPQITKDMLDFYETFARKNPN